MRDQIQELSKSEADCLFEEGLYKTLESSSKAGIYILQDGRFRFVNRHAARYWGYNRDELVGVSSMKLVHPEDREKVRERDQDAQGQARVILRIPDCRKRR